MDTTSPAPGGKPLVCKLTSRELLQRKESVIATLKQLVVSRTELSDGYSYTFKGDDETVDQLVNFIKTERACCGFFTFTLTVTEENAVLAMTGPEGARAFIDSEIGL